MPCFKFVLLMQYQSIAIAVICSIWWVIASNYYINNTAVETNTDIESVQEELYWNAK